VTSSEQALLQQAARRLFIGGVQDVAQELCQANMTYGLARILFAEEWAGVEPQALFIGAPDATVTRNVHRWRHGFGYGGQVRYNPHLAILDSKPNGCGMLVGAIETAPDLDQLRQAVLALRSTTLELDGVVLTHDLTESNHFIDVLELDQALHPVQGLDLPRHLFVIHSSGHEHRPRSPLGPGLYLDESDTLHRMATVLPTPWGPVSLLIGQDAAAFHDFCLKVQDFNMRRRVLYGDRLFGRHQVVCNATHQGIRAPGCFHLGSYWFDHDRQLFPLTLGPDQPVYLLRPRPNLSPEVIQQLGWTRRADETGCTQALQHADLLPHGGGYSFPHLRRLIRVESDGPRRTFWLEPLDGSSPIAIEDARDLPFVYRDVAVLHRLEQLQLATAVARYHIRHVVRE